MKFIIVAILVVSLVGVLSFASINWEAGLTGIANEGLVWGGGLRLNNHSAELAGMIKNNELDKIGLIMNINLWDFTVHMGYLEKFNPQKVDSAPISVEFTDNGKTVAKETITEWKEFDRFTFIGLGLRHSFGNLNISGGLDLVSRLGEVNLSPFAKISYIF